MKTWRILLLTDLFVVCFWFVPLSHFNNASAQEPKKIALCFSGTGINQYVLGITQKNRIFLRNGIDPLIVYIGSGSLMSQALVAGTFDVALSIGSESMVTKLRGADRRIIAVIANHFNHVYITRPEITSIRQLKGGKVAISRFGSGSEFMTDLVLKEGGLNPKKDVTMLQIGNSSARLAALLSRGVDGSIMTADFIPRAKKLGLNVLVDLAESKIEYPFLALSMMGFNIQHNTTIVKGLIRSISDGIRLFQTDRSAAKAAIGEALRTNDPETLGFVATRSAKVLERRPFPTRGGIQTALDELSEAEPAGKNGRFEDFVDLRALRELDQEGVFK